jgi:tripartite-type tricarboxylate transporter receptor subunit TctC
MRRAFAAIVLVAVHAAGWAAEAEYPAKPIRVIVPFAPGGATDLLVRPVGGKIAELLGQSILIDNRGGAGGNIGAELVAQAAPDGYTLLVTTAGVVVANRSLYRKISMDPTVALDPVSIIASLPNVLVVSPKAGIGSVAELIARAKSRTGNVTFASGGNGTSNHLAGELLKHLTQVEMTHIPYKGGGPAVAATLAGEVTLLFATMPSAMQHVKSGRLAALAVTSEKRSPAAPEVPTMAEAGVKGFDVSENWEGALVPRGTPGPIVDRLQKAIARSADDPEVRARLSAAGYEVVAGTSAEMRQAITRQARSWAQVIKAAKIQAD